MTTAIVYCQFCGLSNYQVAHMFAAPSAAICSECVALCKAIADDLQAPPFDELGEHFAQEISG